MQRLFLVCCAKLSQDSGGEREAFRGARSQTKEHVAPRDDFIVGGDSAEWEQPGGRYVALANVDLVVNFSDGFGLVDAAGVVSLLTLPFAHEDLAIVFGAYAIVTDWLPAGLVALCIYGGMVASDFALYCIGAAARRLPWLGRFAVNDRVHRFGQNLKGNLFGLFALSRLVPGTAFVTFVACGWARVRLARFIVASLSISALYLPLTLYLAVVFGDVLDTHVGLWSWSILLVALTATAFVRRRVFAFGGREDVNEFTCDDGADGADRDELSTRSTRNWRMVPQSLGVFRQ